MVIVFIVKLQRHCETRYVLVRSVSLPLSVIMMVHILLDLFSNYLRSLNVNLSNVLNYLLMLGHTLNMAVLVIDFQRNVQLNYEL